MYYTFAKHITPLVVRLYCELDDCKTKQTLDFCCIRLLVFCKTLVTMETIIVFKTFASRFLGHGRLLPCMDITKQKTSKKQSNQASRQQGRQQSNQTSNKAGKRHMWVRGWEHFNVQPRVLWRRELRTLCHCYAIAALRYATLRCAVLCSALLR